MSLGSTEVVQGSSGKHQHILGAVLGSSGRHRTVPGGHRGGTGKHPGGSRRLCRSLEGTGGRVWAGNGARGAPVDTGMPLGGMGLSLGCHRHTSMSLGTLGGAVGRRASPAPLPGNNCRRLRMRGAGGGPVRTTSPGRLCGACRPGVLCGVPSPCRRIARPWRRPQRRPGRRRTWTPTTASASTATSSAPTSWRECRGAEGSGPPGEGPRPGGRGLPRLRPAR